MEAEKVLIWDRKAEGGFPGMMTDIRCILYVLTVGTETKVLKQRVRDHIDPNRDLGHSDRHGKNTKEKKDAESSSEGQKDKDVKSENQETKDAEAPQTKRNPDGTVCEDCR